MEKMRDLVEGALKKRKILAYVIVGVVLIVLGFVLFSDGGNGKGDVLIVEKRPFVQKVSASGKVVAAQRVDLVFSNSGRVSNVYADVGESVAKGKVIATLENGDVYARVLEREAAYEAAQAKLASLKAGTRSEQIAVSEAQRDETEVAYSEARQKLVNEIKKAYTDADDALYHRVDQFITNPRGKNPDLDFLTSRSTELVIENGRYQLQPILVTWKEEVNSLTERDDIERVVESTLARLESVRSFLDTVASAVNALTPSGNISQTTINTYRADMATARDAIHTAIEGVTAAHADMRNAQTAQTTAERNLVLDKAGATQEAIVEQEANVKAARATLESARAEYRKTLVVAPFDGLVTTMDARVGGMASANESLISMISSDTLHIESFVPEINMPLISVGDKAVITLDAYGENTPFIAHVVSIDPAETIRDGVSTYRVILQFNTQDPRVRSGMTANISITTEEKENVVTIPQGVVINRDGEQFVTVLESGIPTERRITTGSISSIGEIEIISGLSEGEVVILETE